MNELSRIAVLVPCEGLADFPTYYRGADAVQLLAAWCTAWRPGLIAAAGRPPEVLCSYHLPESDNLAESAAGQRFDGGLVLVPSPAIEDEVRMWIDQARLEFGERIAVLDSFASAKDIIAGVKESPWAALTDHTERFDQELAALGYALLQVALMTGADRESGWFDRRVFDDQAVAAARAAVANDESAFDAALRAAYDQLENLRNHTYPTKTWLLDTVLVAETTLGERLQQELVDPTPKTLRLTGPLAKQIAESGPLTAALREAVDADRLSLALGDPASSDAATPWALLNPESMADEIDTGADAIQAAAGAAPRIAAPWSSALPPRLPQALVQRGFNGLLVGGLDGGDVPYAEHTKANLGVPEGATLPAVVRHPHPLDAAETFLKWGDLLAESLQSDPIATLPLCGWAGCRSEFLPLLQTVARRSPVLGEFATADRYFAETAAAERDATPAAAALAPTSKTKLPQPKADQPDPAQDSANHHLLSGLADLLGAPPADGPAARCAAAVGAGVPGDAAAPSAGNPIAVHPWSFPRVGFGKNQTVRYDLPGCGFAVGEAINKPANPRASGKTLRNEHARLQIDPGSGGVRALAVPKLRGPFLSQRIAVGHGHNRAGWVSMHAETIEEAIATPAGGTITTSGQLRDRRGAPLARFRQTVSLPAGSGHFLARVEIAPLDPAAEHRWFAWRVRLHQMDGPAWRGVQWQRLPHQGRQAVATDYYELTSHGRRLCLSGDRPMLFRRQDEQALDAVLADGLTEPITRELAVGFDQQRPLEIALTRGAPLAEFNRPLGAPSGWWLHVDTPNVLVSRIESREPGGAAGRARVHLIETQGRPVTATLRMWRPLRSLDVIDAAQADDRCRLDETGAARLPIVGHGWLRIEVSW